ncbi:hypothetical protein [Pedomonas mirosovicensis]|uniref:hypothetical protein n=1 Tax=Pedomonas mirosovicensis TaxID=2908641 RepID=UPI0021692B02|nr:hypothetical protein [Pedomonas mirosovicensis]MCH8686400.1 hypothetical protein [Pedomonas mirosovicensis]
MKHELVLGIAAASLLGLPAYAATATAAAPLPAASQPAKGGGKCASGKCGTEKIYSQAKITHDPNGKLVRARDGKCGPSGKGYNVVQSRKDRLAEGVCGS